LAKARPEDDRRHRDRRKKRKGREYDEKDRGSSSRCTIL
jgi:hypothetical protein